MVYDPWQDRLNRQRYADVEAAQRREAVAQAKREAEAKRKRQAAREAREAVARKARLERIFAKYERPSIMEYSPQPTANATKLWHDAVALAKSQGHDNRKAVSLANRRNPGLRQRMLEEVNG